MPTDQRREAEPITDARPGPAPAPPPDVYA
jgi:hypothetical protein